MAVNLPIMAIATDSLHREEPVARDPAVDEFLGPMPPRSRRAARSLVTAAILVIPLHLATSLTVVAFHLLPDPTTLSSGFWRGFLGPVGHIVWVWLVASAVLWRRRRRDPHVLREQGELYVEADLTFACPRPVRAALAAGVALYLAVGVGFAISLLLIRAFRALSASSVSTESGPVGLALSIFSVVGFFACSAIGVACALQVRESNRHLAVRAAKVESSASLPSGAPQLGSEPGIGHVNATQSDQRISNTS